MNARKGQSASLTSTNLTSLRAPPPGVRPDCVFALVSRSTAITHAYDQPLAVSALEALFVPTGALDITLKPKVAVAHRKQVFTLGNALRPQLLSRCRVLRPTDPQSPESRARPSDPSSS